MTLLPEQGPLQLCVAGFWGKAGKAKQDQARALYQPQVVGERPHGTCVWKGGRQAHQAPALYQPQHTCMHACPVPLWSCNSSAWYPPAPAEMVDVEPHRRLPRAMHNILGAGPGWSGAKTSKQNLALNQPQHTRTSSHTLHAWMALCVATKAW
jgi:hypothetical protein